MNFTLQGSKDRQTEREQRIRTGKRGNERRKRKWRRRGIGKNSEENFVSESKREHEKKNENVKV